MSMRDTCQIGIVAHIDRLAQVATLADHTDAEHICVDDGTLGCDGNHYRVWGQLSDGAAPWSVVLEDDAQPVYDFSTQVVGVLRNAPAPIVSLYLGRTRPPAWQGWCAAVTAKATATGACYIIGNRLLHGVGVAIHRPLVSQMLTATRDLALPVDEAITAWARCHRYPIAYCWPSIVDHLDLPTLVAHRDGKPRDKPRTAWCVGGRNTWHTRV